MVDTPENTRHNQLMIKRDYHACSTYQQILKACTKCNLINYSTYPLVTLSIVLDAAKLRSHSKEKVMQSYSKEKPDNKEILNSSKK